jgi:hypothetical protein
MTPERTPLFLVAVEDDAVPDLAAELPTGHVRFVPAVLWYDAPVGLSPIIDDLKDGIKVAICANPYHYASLEDVGGRG